MKIDDAVNQRELRHVGLSLMESEATASRIARVNAFEPIAFVTPAVVR